MVVLESHFEAIFRVPPAHSLIAVRSRSRAGMLAGTFWNHEEYDAAGRLVARYESFEESGLLGRDRQGGWRKYDPDGRLVAKGELFDLWR